MVMRPRRNCYATRSVCVITSKRPNLLDLMIEIKTVYGHTKILTAQLSNWISCGGRMEYHAMVYDGGDKCPW